MAAPAAVVQPPEPPPALAAESPDLRLNKLSTPDKLRVSISKQSSSSLSPKLPPATTTSDPPSQTATKPAASDGPAGRKTPQASTSKVARTPVESQEKSAEDVAVTPESALVTVKAEPRKSGESPTSSKGRKDPEGAQAQLQKRLTEPIRKTIEVVLGTRTYQQLADVVTKEHLETAMRALRPERITTSLSRRTLFEEIRRNAGPAETEDVQAAIKSAQSYGDLPEWITRAQLQALLKRLRPERSVQPLSRGALYEELRTVVRQASASPSSSSPPGSSSSPAGSSGSPPAASSDRSKDLPTPELPPVGEPWNLTEEETQRVPTATLRERLELVRPDLKLDGYSRRSILDALIRADRAKPTIRKPREKDASKAAKERPPSEPRGVATGRGERRPRASAAGARQATLAARNGGMGASEEEPAEGAIVPAPSGFGPAGPSRPRRSAASTPPDREDGSEASGSGSEAEGEEAAEAEAEAEVGGEADADADAEEASQSGGGGGGGGGGGRKGKGASSAAAAAGGRRESSRALVKYEPPSESPSPHEGTSARTRPIGPKQQKSASGKASSSSKIDPVTLIPLATLESLPPGAEAYLPFVKRGRGRPKGSTKSNPAYVAAKAAAAAATAAALNAVKRRRDASIVGVGGMRVGYGHRKLKKQRLADGSAAPTAASAAAGKGRGGAAAGARRGVAGKRRREDESGEEENGEGGAGGDEDEDEDDDGMDEGGPWRALPTWGCSNTPSMAEEEDTSEEEGEGGDGVGRGHGQGQGHIRPLPLPSSSGEEQQQQQQQPAGPGALALARVPPSVSVLEGELMMAFAARAAAERPAAVFAAAAPAPAAAHALPTAAQPATAATPAAAPTAAAAAAAAAVEEGARPAAVPVAIVASSTGPARPLRPTPPPGTEQASEPAGVPGPVSALALREGGYDAKPFDCFLREDVAPRLSVPLSADEEADLVCKVANEGKLGTAGDLRRYLRMASQGLLPPHVFAAGLPALFTRPGVLAAVCTLFGLGFEL
eukprot:tig00020801_g13959.t1